MNKTPILLVSLVVFLTAGLARADAPSAPAERRASVIVPMLSHFSPQDTTRQSVMGELTHILGRFDNNGFGGGPGKYWTFYSYRLDDYTQIIVEFTGPSGYRNPQLVLILAQLPNGKLVELGGIPLVAYAR